MVRVPRIKQKFVLHIWHCQWELSVFEPDVMVVSRQAIMQEKCETRGSPPTMERRRAVLELQMPQKASALENGGKWDVTSEVDHHFILQNWVSVALVSSLTWVSKVTNAWNTLVFRTKKNQLEPQRFLRMNIYIWFISLGSFWSR